MSYTRSEHIVKWNQASDDWHCPTAENDLQPGGRFSYRMEARDGSAGFDFSGAFDEVTPNQSLSYTMDDGRKAYIQFNEGDQSAEVTITFDPEDQNSVELQREGWQAILQSFKRYTESQ